VWVCAEGKRLGHGGAVLGKIFFFAHALPILFFSFLVLYRSEAM
jgi:hypothetical protein